MERDANTAHRVTACQTLRSGADDYSNIKASQAKLKAMGRALTLEQVYVLEMGDTPEDC